MSEWADVNRQAHGRCHDCWNLDPCCTCPIEGEWWVKTETLSLDQIKARYNPGPWLTAEHWDACRQRLQPHYLNPPPIPYGLYDQLADSVELSNHDIVAEAYRVLYDC